MARGRDYVRKGWPDVNTVTEVRHYFARKTELSVLGGCVLWGTRVVVPPQARTLLLTDLHDSQNEEFGSGTCEVAKDGL